ncbi:hypothetical protein EDB81DRAFT_105050 [Dactylonectria macrodidyma]|uniref:Secreted protein n=1 Tax=Dactylonectria macrodidyma TaxID=307937 RepID=A0A9P9ISF1_9HYPO|nr:hypothetical protein EDB81DRAFT_105050 [Dactylonectria macrodidyma]
MAEWALSVLELVMELMRLPASFLVMVAGAWDGVDGRTLGHKAESGLGEHSRTVGRETGESRAGRAFTSCLDADADSQRAGWIDGLSRSLVSLSMSRFGVEVRVVVADAVADLDGAAGLGLWAWGGLR